jgi:hypothetical protein
MVRKYIALSGLALCLGFLAQAGKVTVKALPSNSGAVNGIPSICGGVDGNLVANCGFETGDFTGWAQSGDTRFTGVDIDSANSGAYGAFFGTIDSLGFIAQNISTTPGQTYALTFYLSNSMQPNQFTISWDGAVISEQADLPDFDYMPVSMDLPAASGDSTELRFGFRNEPDYLRLDDVSVVPN